MLDAGTYGAGYCTSDTLGNLYFWPGSSASPTSSTPTTRTHTLTIPSPQTLHVFCQTWCVRHGRRGEGGLHSLRLAHVRQQCRVQETLCRQQHNLGRSGSLPTVFWNPEDTEHEVLGRHYTAAAVAYAAGDAGSRFCLYLWCVYMCLSLSCESNVDPANSTVFRPLTPHPSPLQASSSPTD